MPRNIPPGFEDYLHETFWWRYELEDESNFAPDNFYRENTQMPAKITRAQMDARASMLNWRVPKPPISAAKYTKARWRVE